MLAYSVEKMAKNGLLGTTGTAPRCSPSWEQQNSLGCRNCGNSSLFSALGDLHVCVPQYVHAATRSDTSVLQGLLGNVVTAAARTIQDLGKKAGRTGVC